MFITLPDYSKAVESLTIDAPSIENVLISNLSVTVPPILNKFVYTKFAPVFTVMS